MIDVSGSMGKLASGGYAENEDDFKDAPISKLITSVNQAIDQLLTASPNSRFGIVIYGSTAAVLVPLGHYEWNADGILTTSFIGQYNKQGVHYTVNAAVTNSETGEVENYYSDNSGQSSNEAHNEPGGSGNRLLAGTGGATTGDGKTSESAFHVGHITNPQAGFAAAMDQFITGNNERTWENNGGKEYLRIPAMIHLTDGQASDIAWIQQIAEAESANGWETKVSNWNNVNWKYDLAYNGKNKSTNSSIMWNASQLTGRGDAAPVIFQTLMTAAYYKSAVDAYYAATGMQASTEKRRTYPASRFTQAIQMAITASKRDRSRLPSMRFRTRRRTFGTATGRLQTAVRWRATIPRDLSIPPMRSIRNG